MILEAYEQQVEKIGNENFEHLIAEMVEHVRRIMDMSSVQDLRWNERLHRQIEHHYSQVYHLLAKTQKPAP